MNADIKLLVANRTPVPELGEGWYLLRADDGDFRDGDKVLPRGTDEWEPYSPSWMRHTLKSWISYPPTCKAARYFGTTIEASLIREGQTITNEQGGKQSFIKARFDAIPPIVLKLLAQCLGFGLRKYGKDNWKQIPKEEHLAHAQNHINEWQLGDRSEPHLVNAMARLSFALWWAVEDGEQPKEYVHPDEVVK